jgi:hypothetical protein
MHPLSFFVLFILIVGVGIGFFGPALALAD